MSDPHGTYATKSNIPIRIFGSMFRLHITTTELFHNHGSKVIFMHTRVFLLIIIYGDDI